MIRLLGRQTSGNVQKVIFCLEELGVPYIREDYGRQFGNTLTDEYRKLNPNAERRLRLSQARAEETIIRGHVDNALMFVDTLAEDLSFDRAIDTYIRVMGIPEPLASTVATRALVHLGRDLVPFRRRMQREGEDVAAENKPRLRLDEASRAGDIKRA